jgi:hypothetical protein
VKLVRYAVFGLPPLVLGAYFPYTDYINQGPHAELQPPYAVPSPNSTTGPLVFLGGLKMLAKTLPAAALAKVTTALGTASESHGCFVLLADPGPMGHSYDAIVCTGVDDLGVVYSVYELSTAVLGVDPQAYWTENTPRPQTSVEVHVPPSVPPPSSGGASSEGARVVSLVPGRVGGGAMSPTFEYRGFFVNDEDMLSGFAQAGG